MSPATIGGEQVDPDPRLTLSDDKALELYITRYHASKDLVRNLRDDWKQWNRLYRGYVPRPDWKFDTNLHIPAIFSTVESFLPRMVSQRPRVKIEARNDEDIPAARVQREVLDYQWDYIGMNVHMIEFAKSGLITGTSVGKLTWLRDTQEKEFLRRVEADNGTVQTFKDTQDVRVYDDPVFDIIELEDFLIDPTATTIENSRYCMQRIKMTWDEIDAWAESTPEWDWDKKAIRELKDAAEQHEDADDDSVKRTLESEFGSGDPIPLKSRAMIFEFEVLEYWEDQRMAVFVASPEKMLLSQKNPYWHQRKPFVKFVDNLMPNSFYGMGEAELLEGLNQELDDVHNLRLEMAKRKIMQMFKVRRGSPPSLMDIQFTPQGKIPIDQPDDITVLFDQDVLPSSYREEDMLRLWIQEASGATDVFKGLATPIGNETATGASLLAQSANSRASIKFQQLVEMTLRPLVEMWVALNEQFIDQERVISIVGPEAAGRKLISPQDIARSGSDLDIRIDIGATDPVSRELRLNRTKEALAVVSQVPPEAMGTPQVQVLMNRMFDLLELPAVQAVAAPPATSPPREGGESLTGQIAGQQSPVADGNISPSIPAQ